MKKILVFGTFDVIHPGHRFFLQEARKHGKRLIAVISRDKFVLEYKGKAPIHSESERMQQIVESGLADEAVLADEQTGSYGVLENIRPDIICLGHDQRLLMENMEHFLNDSTLNPSVVMLAPFRREKFSSSLLNKHKYRRKKLVFFALMVMAMGLWGLSWTSAKIIAGMASPTYLVLLRSLISAVAFLPLMLRKKEKWRLPWQGWLWTLGCAALYTAYNQLFFRGLITGLAGKGGIIVTTMNPLFAFIMVSIILKKAPKKLQIAGVAAGLTGGILMIQPWRYTTAELLKSGNLLFLIAALLWALLTLMTAQSLKRASVVSYNFYMYLFSVVLNAVFLLKTPMPQWRSLPPYFWINIVFLGLMASAVATYLYFSATKKLGAARTSGFTFLVPAFAVTASWSLLKERPDWLTLAGGVICLSSVYMINRIKRTV